MMIDFKITKKVKILEVNNEMAHNYYYMLYGKIYNEEKTKYRKFKFVEWFDIFDIVEYFEKDKITKNDIKEYLNSLEIPYIYNIKNYDDIEHLQEFYNYCNETIKKYNDIAKYY